MKIIIGSRGSDLALTQSRYIKKRLSELPDAPETEIKIIKTSGDQILNVSLAELGSNNDRKGIFTKEIEDALLAGEIDIAVHSFKDMPTQDVPGLRIGAMPQRVNTEDVLVFRKADKISDEPPFIKADGMIGTSSVRRVAQLTHLWPDLKTVSIRGNVPTRVRKVLEGEGDVKLDGVMLARAGMERLIAEGVFDKEENKDLLKDLEIAPLPADIFIPAPAQGALAIQCRENDAGVLALLSKLHENDAARSVEAERIVLADMEGGCHLPLGASCRPEGQEFALRVFVGQEAQDNNRGRSLQFARFGRDHKTLAGLVVDEIKNRPAILLTGRAERVAELKSQYPDLDLIEKPLIRTDEIKPDTADLDALRNLFAEADETKKLPIAVFSVPGARALANLLTGESLTLPPGAFFAVTGERTAAALKQFFPDIPADLKSPDGTGAGLARALLEDTPEFKFSKVLAISAEYGRREFYELLEQANHDVLNLKLYRTLNNPLNQAERDALPQNCLVILGSPSAALAYLGKVSGDKSDNDDSSLQAAIQAEPSTRRLCALGPTTADFLRQNGITPYCVARTPDFEMFIKELS